MQSVTYLGQEGSISAAITVDGTTFPDGKPVEVSEALADRCRAQESDGHKFEIKDVKGESSSSKSTGAKKTSDGASKVSNR